MIKLRHLLTEAQTIPQTVYHFTLPKYFVNMVKTNTIKADPRFNQISFTADPDLWAFREFPEEDQEIGVRLEFDTSKLPPLKPFKYSGAPGEDYGYEEEYTTNVGDLKPGNLMSFVKSVAADSFWKDYLESQLPPDVFSKIEFI